MATLVLQAVGSVVGEAVGGPFGAIIGRVVGATAGALIDHKLFGQGSAGRSVGPRLTTLAGLTSTEGAAMPRVYGRVRVGGQMIWATRFEEIATTTRSGGSGGKGGGPRSTSYAYFANFAVGLCAGEIAEVRRVWADGKEIDVTKYTMRIHSGAETQAPDPLIVAKQGAGNTPAYRGLAYVVFERLPLADFGNRVPQLAFEVVRAVNGLAKRVRAIDLIPGATEYAYATTTLLGAPAPGVSVSENRHQRYASSDMIASLDALQALCPNLESVALVVAWYGDDLRAGHCTLAPRVERSDKIVSGQAWQVAQYNRATARPVSLVNGAPAFGGTPPDSVVVNAVAELKSRGLKVVFYPFVMMDIAAGNALADPWSGAASQPAYPWRGRITCDPAPGQPASPDGASAAADQVAAFFGAGATPANDRYHSFILHYAQLCASAGGVDAFLIGSELAALTGVRSASGVYPAANALAALAADAKAVLGATTKISYAADWTEYGAQVRGGGAEVRFPLDVVWSSPAVDFIGIDAYFPLSDWRDGQAHLDAAIARSVYDPAYLRARVASGEAWEWYYADDAARAAQRRTSITDGAFGKPWVFRQKDIAGWWSNPHVERVGGAELALPTAWTPRGKPVWLTEIGCPAVDRGANQPNVFPDTKSSEARLPHFSRGWRDDLMQTRALEAMLNHFDPADANFTEPSNPMSSVYGGRMVDISRIHIWAWDARPFPAFPMQSNVWVDAKNWETGHWLNGRLEGAPLDDLVTALVAASGLIGPLVERPAIDGFVDGYALDRVLPARAAIEPLAALFGFDGILTGGSLRFAGRSAGAARSLGVDDLVAAANGELVALKRGQESETPNEIELTFAEGLADYRTSAVLSRRLEGGSRRQSEAEVAVVMERAPAHRLADIWLQDLWIGRETAHFAVRPGLAELEIGDAVSLTIAGRPRLFRILQITDGAERKIEARAIEPSVYDAAPPSLSRAATLPPPFAGPPQVLVLDLAIARSDPPALQFIAVFADPWHGPQALWRANGAASFDFVRALDRPSFIATTLDPLPAGPPGRLDLFNSFRVRAPAGTLVSVSDIQMFGGANVAAVLGGDGAWEMIAFANAELIGPGEWRLSRLLRGLGGAEALASRVLPANAQFVRLDDAVTPLTTTLADIGVPVRWRIGPANVDVGDPAVTEFTTTPKNLPLLSYSPVQASARRVDAGVAIAFQRRGRRDADTWEIVDIPLGEQSEAYEIDILNGGAVVRTLKASTPSLTYASADELADFGAPLSHIELRLAQLSASVGRGYALHATLLIA